MTVPMLKEMMTGLHGLAVASDRFVAGPDGQVGIMVRFVVRINVIFGGEARGCAK